MKNVLFIIVIVLAIMNNNCSKCYECSKDAEILNNGIVVDTNTITDNICTASGREIEDKENNGYTCTPE